MQRSHGCLGGTGDNRALIALLVLLVPLNVTYPDECGKYQPIVEIMPLYLLLSDQGLGHMKWVKDERCKIFAIFKASVLYNHQVNAIWMEQV